MRPNVVVILEDDLDWNDLGEQNRFAANQPEKAAEPKSTPDEYLKSTGATMPVPNHFFLRDKMAPGSTLPAQKSDHRLVDRVIYA